MKAEKMRCPRREENPQSDLVFPGPDKWRKDRSRRGVRFCSYCGSINPDDFMEYARRGTAEFGPTNKSYKVYVTDPFVTYVPMSSSWQNGKRISVTKHPRTTARLKFYFQHLSEDQRREFVDLYNARPKRRFATFQDATEFEPGNGMQVGYPGYFYQMPFFMGHAS